jgi:asparagine synthase (glutamine-hydrolysing)
MPGIFGVLLKDPNGPIEPREAASALCHGGTGSFEEFRESGVYLAACSARMWTTDRYVLILEGLLLEPDPETLALGILRNPERTLRGSNGEFALALYDRIDRRLILATDRLGTKLLYSTETSDLVAFSSEAKALIRLPSVEAGADLRSVFDLLAFGYTLGNRCLFRGVTLADYGSYEILKSSGRIRGRYFDFPEVREEEASPEEGVEALRNAVLRRWRDGAGLLLSGGMDTRTLAACLKDRPVRVALTFGGPDSLDVRLARQIAERLGLPHRTLEISPDYLSRFGEHVVFLTEGMTNCIHAHGIEHAEEVGREANAYFNGVIGGALLGAHLADPSYFRPVPPHRLGSALFRKTHHILSRDLARGILRDPDRFLRTARENFFREFGKIRTKRGDDRIYFYLLPVRRKVTLFGTVIDRPYFEDLMPFADRDLLRFALSLSPRERIGARWYRWALSRLAPELTDIPWTYTGLPPRAGTARGMLRLALNKIRRRSYLDYADYAGWFRGELRDFLADLLLHPSEIIRSLFRPGAVESVLDEHLKGVRDRTDLLGVLMTLELWERIFLAR